MPVLFAQMICKYAINPQICLHGNSEIVEFSTPLNQAGFLSLSKVLWRWKFLNQNYICGLLSLLCFITSTEVKIRMICSTLEYDEILQTPPWKGKFRIFRIFALIQSEFKLNFFDAKPSTLKAIAMALLWLSLFMMSRRRWFRKLFFAVSSGLIKVVTQLSHAHHDCQP